MNDRSRTANDEQRDQLVAQMRREEQGRQLGYREQALKLFPHVCARCTREFEGKNLRELTVHHKDHDHDNNPPDGSNWELLCIYCHDNEHSRLEVSDAYAGEEASGDGYESDTTHKPFANLQDLLKGGNK